MNPQLVNAQTEAVPDIDRAALAALVATVLHVPLERVVADADLVQDLGAESIDFLDLIFGIDAVVGRQVLPEQWTEFVRSRLPGFQGRGITLSVLEEFAQHAAAGTKYVAADAIEARS